MNAPRTVITVALCALPLVFGLAGCGAKSDADQINEVAHQFAADAKAKNWDGVCSAMSTKARAQVQIAAAFLGGKDCASLMKIAVAAADDSDKLGKLDPDDMKVTGLKVTGDRATGKMSGEATRFVREDGDWKLDVDADDETGSATTSAGSTGDDNTAEVAAPKLKVAERGFSRIGDRTSYGVVVENPTGDDALDVEVQTNLIGADGGVVATETDSLAAVPAGERVNIGGDAESSGDRVRSLEITVTADSGATAGTVELPKTSRVRLSRPQFGGLEVRAQLRNTLDKPLSSIADVFAVVRGANGQIVGGMSTFPETKVRPGGRAAVELSAFEGIPGATSADVSVDPETTE